MFLWDETAYDWFFSSDCAGVPGESLDPAFTARMTFAYMLSVSFGGALISTKLAQMEIYLAKIADSEPKGLSSVAIELSNLIQMMLSWVSGNSVIYMLYEWFPVLNAGPKVPESLLHILAITLFTFLLSCLWLIANAGTVAESLDGDRTAVERYFITNAMAFFNGWNLYLLGKLALCKLIIAMKGPFKEWIDGTAGDVFHLTEVGEDKFTAALFIVVVLPAATTIVVELTFVLTDCYSALADLGEDERERMQSIASGNEAFGNFSDSPQLRAAQTMAARVMQRSPMARKVRRSRSRLTSEESAKMFFSKPGALHRSSSSSSSLTLTPAAKDDAVIY